MKRYLTLQYDYENFEISLCKQGIILDSTIENKFNAIESMLPAIINLLKKHTLSLHDLSAIGVNCGPGPYNTLRALIATVNGLRYTTPINLVSVDALSLLQQESTDPNNIVILNAFAKHIFYSIKKNNIIIDTGYCTTDQLIEKVIIIDATYTVVGNGAILYQAELSRGLGTIITFSEQIVAFNSNQTLAQAVYAKIMAHDFVEKYLEPVYLQ